MAPSRTSLATTSKVDLCGAGGALPAAVVGGFRLPGAEAVGGRVPCVLRQVIRVGGRCSDAHHAWLWLLTYRPLQRTWRWLRCDHPFAPSRYCSGPSRRTPVLHTLEIPLSGPTCVVPRPWASSPRLEPSPILDASCLPLPSSPAPRADDGGHRFVTRDAVAAHREVLQAALGALCNLTMNAQVCKRLASADHLKLIVDVSSWAHPARAPRDFE